MLTLPFPVPEFLARIIEILFYYYIVITMHIYQQFNLTTVQNKLENHWNNMGFVPYNDGIEFSLYYDKRLVKNPEK